MIQVRPGDSSSPGRERKGNGVSAQGGYDDLSTPHLASEEDDVEQILMEMVDSGELELVWLEDQGDFGFFKPETTREEPRIPTQGAHAAPKSSRRANLRRAAIMTFAAFVSPLVVGSAYASVIKGKPSLPLIIQPDTPDPAAVAQPAPVPSPSVTSTPAPKTTKTVPVKAMSKAKKAEPTAAVPTTYERHQAVSGHHRHHRHENWNWDGDDAAGDLLTPTGRHRGLPDPDELEDEAQRVLKTLPHTVQEVTQHTVQVPISSRDLLHHRLHRQENPQVSQLGGKETDSGNRQNSIALDALDRTGNQARGLTTSSATPLDTKVVSAA